MRPFKNKLAKCFTAAGTRDWTQLKSSSSRCGVEMCCLAIHFHARVELLRSSGQAPLATNLLRADLVLRVRMVTSRTDATVGSDECMVAVSYLISIFKMSCDTLLKQFERELKVSKIYNAD